MKKHRIFKWIGFSFLGAGIVAGIGYASLSNRHQAIVKTTLLQTTGLLQNQWKAEQNAETITLQSPTFWVDGIYKSMEGPKSTKPVQINAENELIWLQGFTIEALDEKDEQPLSNEFICHMNIDLIEANYYSKFDLGDRVGKWYPRVTSLSHGQEQFQLPKGYGFPMMGNEVVYLTTQTLNHNYEKIDLKVKHEVKLQYTRDRQTKPLMSRTVYIQLPYEWAETNKGPLDDQANLCLPVETKNHSYLDAMGNKVSGHWIIPKGKNSYQSEINSLLQLKDSLRLHAAAVHVHPFAESLRLVDRTTNTILFESKITNYTDKIGLKSVDAFSSEEGIWLYPNHDYALELDVNNTSAVDQDMMGSMFLFFYDQEMDRKLTEKGL